MPTTIRLRRPGRQRRRRAAVHQLLPPGRLHRAPARAPTPSEQSPAAKDAIAQILTNSKMCAEGHRPICQDTGIVNVFPRRSAWTCASRASGLDRRRHQRRRAPRLPRPREQAARLGALRPAVRAQEHERQHAGRDPHAPRAGQHAGRLTVAAKGGGSENKSKFIMMNPSDNLVDWVLKTVPTMGAGWCPPGMLGIGVGGTAEKAMLLAKEALMEPIDMFDLLPRPEQQAGRTAHRGSTRRSTLGIGAQGLGGLTTGARREDRHLPDARGEQAGGDDPQLRGDAPRPRHARRLAARPARTRPAWTCGPTCTGSPTTTEPEGRPRHAHAEEESRAGSRATRCCSTARCSPAATPRTSASRTCWPGRAAAGGLPPTASSTTSARSTRCATRWSAPGPTTATRMDKFTEMMLSETGRDDRQGRARRWPSVGDPQAPEPT